MTSRTRDPVFQASARAAPVRIAPASIRTPIDNADGSVLLPMRFNCQACARKKIKCDRAIPVCSGCRKAKLECIYQAPLKPRRKRKHREDVHELLARYERILEDNGLLQAATGQPSPQLGTEDTPRETQKAPSSSSSREVQITGGKLVGKSRYVDNVLLLDAGEGDLRDLSDSEDDGTSSDGNVAGNSTPAGLSLLMGDTVSASMLGMHRNLAEFHPHHNQAMKLWEAYLKNVEPICRMVHVPTAMAMVTTVSNEPTSANKSDECLLFAIYYFAVFSMTDAECMLDFGTARDTLLTRYQTAVCHALVNASWLKSTSLTVVQAYILFLIPLRTQVDLDTFWILTGIAVRLAQRIGLHRDGESLGLPPFEVQMRRRIFWQLLPLDGYAGQVCGTGISIAPDSWDTKRPLNVNDDQIYPGMTERPQELKGASEMIFCLTRMELSNLYIRTGVKMKDSGPTIQFRDAAEVTSLIDEVEERIESKYLRYCDILNPLHVLTMGVARSAINAMRVRNQMPPLLQNTMDDSKRRELCDLAQKVLDTDGAIYQNPQLTRFQWRNKGFFIWDALLCILLSLAKREFLSDTELDAVWGKVANVYLNHPELLASKKALYVTVGKVTLDAWDSNPPSGCASEPTFINGLRARRRAKTTDRSGEVQERVGSIADDQVAFDMLFGNMDSDVWEDGSFGAASDWMFWERLCQGQDT